MKILYAWLILFLAQTILFSAPNRDAIAFVSTPGYDPDAGFITKIKGIYFAIASSSILKDGAITLTDVDGNPIPYRNMFQAADRGVLLIRLAEQSERPYIKLAESFGDEDVFAYRIENYGAAVVESKSKARPTSLQTASVDGDRKGIGVFVTNSSGEALAIYGHLPVVEMIGVYSEMLDRQTYELPDTAYSVALRLDNINDWVTASSEEDLAKSLADKIMSVHSYTVGSYYEFSKDVRRVVTKRDRFVNSGWKTRTTVRIMDRGIKYMDRVPMRKGHQRFYLPEVDKIMKDWMEKHVSGRLDSKGIEAENSRTISILKNIIRSSKYEAEKKLRESSSAYEKSKFHAVIRLANKVEEDISDEVWAYELDDDGVTGYMSFQP